MIIFLSIFTLAVLVAALIFFTNFISFSPHTAITDQYLNLFFSILFVVLLVSLIWFSLSKPMLIKSISFWVVTGVFFIMAVVTIKDSINFTRDQFGKKEISLSGRIKYVSDSGIVWPTTITIKIEGADGVYKVSKDDPSVAFYKDDKFYTREWLDQYSLKVMPNSRYVTGAVK